MDYMFYKCYELDSLDLSSFVTTSITAMNALTYGCISMKILDISNIDFKNLDKSKYFGLDWSNESFKSVITDIGMVYC
jgi:surface protein